LASAEAPRASRRARRLARLDLTIVLKRRERAAGQDAGLVAIEPPAEATHARAVWQVPNASNDPPNQTDASEPLGKTLGSSQSNHPPKRHTRKLFGKHRMRRTIRRSAASEPSGKTPGPLRTIRRSDIRASRLASRRARLKACAAARAAAHTAPSTERSVKQAAATEPRAIRRSSRRRRYRTEPLRLFAVNPLTVGELGKIVMGGIIPV